MHWNNPQIRHHEKFTIVNRDRLLQLLISDQGKGKLYTYRHQGDQQKDDIDWPFELNGQEDRINEMEELKMEKEKKCRATD